MDAFATTYLGVFLDELEEQLLTLDHALLELEKGGNLTETIQKIFRAAHTLKGSSAAMGFHHMKEVTHRVESVFDLLRQERLPVSSSLVNTLFGCIDYLKVQRETLRQGLAEDKPDERLLRLLDDCMSGREQTEPAEAAEAGDEISWGPRERDEIERKAEEGVPLYLATVSLLEEADMPTVRAMLVHRALTENGEVVAVYPSLDDWDDESRLLSGPIAFVVASSRSSEEIEANVLQLSQIGDARVCVFEPAARADRAREGHISDTAAVSTPAGAPVPATGADPEAATPSGEGKTPIQQTVRVDVKRLEHLLDLVGELIIDNTRLQEVRKRLNESRKQEPEVALLGEVTDHLNRVIAELQEGMMKTRMLPIEQLFNRFPRLVRDLAQQAGKEIEFAIEGKETELDRTLIEEIGDPLIHILRNSADHGLEAPEERERLGKPRKGRLHLQASHQENAIVIRVKDDGRGIDPAKVRAKAISKGFIAEEDATRMSDKEAISLIFHSGMSTAERVTELSGRGVGMDIVRSRIEKLNGLIEIDTAPGQGTEITIKLPLTLAITRSLLVELGKHAFAIPLVHVLETFQLSSADIQSVHGKEICTVRGEIYPLVRLHAKLRTEPNGSGKGYAVMIGAADRRVCLFVDRLVANQEIVMKPLSPYLGQVSYASGASILGNGSIAFILDVNAVAREAGTAIDPHRDNRGANVGVSSSKRVTFLLGEQSYAFDIGQVKEIIRVPALTQVSSRSTDTLGVMNLRDRLLPVIDISRRLGLAPSTIEEDSRVIVMSDGESDIGILVDSVAEVVDMPDHEVEETPASLSGGASDFVRGIRKSGDRLTVLLRMEKLLGTERYRTG